MITVAIDGPSGAGKSTIARAIAKKMQFVYVDTGALYRVIGLYILRAGKDTKNCDEVKSLLAHIFLALKYVNGEQRVFLEDEDVSDLIRTEQVSMAASDVSAHVPVRSYLLETQRRLAIENNVIMDGRDIGTVVLPKAQVKIFLTASVECRAMRRYKQLIESGMEANLETITKDVIQRDYNDTHRAAAPLKKADDAIEVDSTEMNFEQVVEHIMRIINDKVGILNNK